MITAPRLAGFTYVAASVGFLMVFAWLASHFGYPDVLERNAAEVLPRLLALGNDGRAVWAAYALLPLLLIPAAAGAVGALRQADGRTDTAVRLGLILQTVAALCMTLGLARWSTAQWSLAQHWVKADEAQRVGLAATFDVLNVFLGNGIGEFVGEATLYGSFIAFAVALYHTGSRKVAVLAVTTAIAGWIGMFRNVTHSVQLAADVTNALLPLFLIVFGVTLLRGKTSRAPLGRYHACSPASSPSRGSARCVARNSAPPGVPASTPCGRRRRWLVH